mmetsp:Transcript_6409/g.9437  ORF Transcript_6409/g.9437 Transcript_6409/m.9437 type:complete len:218 (+) Transcript_6409:3671-4324(+)
MASSKTCKPKNLLCGFCALSSIAPAFAQRFGASCSAMSALFAADLCGDTGSYAAATTLSSSDTSISFALGSSSLCAATSMLSTAVMMPAGQFSPSRYICSGGHTPPTKKLLSVRNDLAVGSRENTNRNPLLPYQIYLRTPITPSFFSDRDSSPSVALHFEIYLLADNAAFLLFTRATILTCNQRPRHNSANQYSKPFEMNAPTSASSRNPLPQNAAN